jgi:hypothetical protein
MDQTADVDERPGAACIVCDKPEMRVMVITVSEFTSELGQAVIGCDACGARYPTPVVHD